MRNISALANLVDYRSNYYEDHRVSEEEIKHRTKHLGWSKASAVCDYYERLNETLDGWREVDEILDSRFPDEVMRRFTEQDERAARKKRHNKQKSKRRLKQQQQQQNGRKTPVESDGNVSDEEETEEEQDRGRGRTSLKRSFSAKAINAFSGLWFGGSGSPRSSSKTDLERGRPQRSNGHHDHHRAKGRAFDLLSEGDEEEEDEEEDEEEANQQDGNGGDHQQVTTLSSSPPALHDGHKQSGGRRDYGATTSASSAGQLYDKLRREGRIEQIRRTESQLALSSGVNTPGSASGTHTPRDATSTPGSRANTIRPNQVENIRSTRGLPLLSLLSPV